MNRIAVTGATSMLGATLIQEAVKHNVEVLAFTHKNSFKISRIPQSPLVKVVECDLQDMKTFDTSNEKCDVFYHFAWGSTDKTIRDNPLPQMQNLQYAFDAVDLAKRLGCKKLVGAGSQAEYGINTEILTPETRVDPVTSYGVAKFAAGKLCTKLCTQKNMICIWPRIFSVYGPYENPSSLISYALSCYQKGEVAKFSAATQNWEYLYQSDAARFLYALGQKVEKSCVYTLSSGQSKPLKEFISDINKVCDGKLKYEFSPPTGVSLVSLKSDISTLTKDTGWKPQVSFEDGIKAVLQAQKDKEAQNG